MPDLPRPEFRSVSAAMLPIHPGLVRLLRLRARATVRRFFRWLIRPAGIVLSVLGVLLIGVWIVPLFIAILLSPPVGPEPIRDFAPVVLLLICLGNIASRQASAVMSFSPAEVNLLYTAPMARRDLITYRLANVLLSSVVMGLIFSAIFMMFRKNPVVTVTGFVLAVLLINLVAVTFAILRETLGTLADTFVRKAVLILLALGALIALLATLPIDLDSGVVENLRAVRDATATRVLLAPFDVYVNILIADSVAAYFGWTGVGIAMVCAVGVVLYRSDHALLEIAAASGRRLQRQKAQAKKRGGMIVRGGSGRWRLPRLPHWTGIGPNLWRQFTCIFRSGRSVAMSALGVSALAVFFAWRIDHGDSPETTFLVIAVLSCLVCAFFLPQSLRFDFRGDLDQMDWLKQLPIHPVSMAAGQVLAPVVVITLVQWLLLLMLSLLLKPDPLYAIVMAAAVVPLNLFNISMENAFFLFSPSRVMGKGLSNIQSTVRTVLLSAIRMTVFIAAVSIAAGMGAGAYFLAGQSWIAGLCVSIFVLTAEALLLFPAIGLLFTRFDVSIDTPA